MGILCLAGDQVDAQEVFSQGNKEAKAENGTDNDSYTSMACLRMGLKVRLAIAYFRKLSIY